jgi:hypothetical protein
MPLTVTEIEQLRNYINGVMTRADHHAGPVNEIALALAGAIIWRKDDDEPIKVMARDGETKNVLWARINGQRYAFSYNHSAGQIEMRRGSTQGQILQAFSNTTPLAELKRVFENL